MWNKAERGETNRLEAAIRSRQVKLARRVNRRLSQRAATPARDAMNKIAHGRIAGAEINCAKAVSGILRQAAWMLIEF
jgi:hypothetical protein